MGVACKRPGDRDPVAPGAVRSRDPAEEHNKMAAFSSYEDEMLVELINKNPPIYDVRLQSYKDNVVRENIWEDIGKLLKKSSNECKKRWKYIRDSYSRWKRKNKLPTGSSASSKTTKWLLLERLRFLDKIPSERKSIATVRDSYVSDEEKSEGIHSTRKIGHRMSREETSGEETSFEGQSEGVTGEAGTCVQPKSGEETSGKVTSDERATGAEKGDAVTIGLKSTKQHPSNEKKSNERENGAGIFKAGIRRIQKKRKLEQENNLHTALLQYWKERDQQRQEQIKNLTAQGSDADIDGINSFCSHIGSILRKLTPGLRVEAKTKVFNVLAEYELKYVTQSSTQSNISSSPMSNTSITYISSANLSPCSPATVASPPAAEPTDLSAPPLNLVVLDDSQCEGYENSTEYVNNYFFTSM